MDMEKIRLENLDRAVEDAGGQAEYAEIVGVSPGYISQMQTGRRPFTEKTAKKHAEKLGLPENWFISVRGSGALIDIEQTVVKTRSDTFRIDQHNDVSGAMGKGVVLNDQPGQITGLQVTMEWAEKNIPSNTGNKNLRVVTGFGDSMKGMFNSGDPLLIDIGVNSVKFDAVYFFRIGDEGFIKRLQRVPGDGIIVISNNPEYRDWTIKPDMDFEVFGRVLKVWKGSDF